MNQKVTDNSNAYQANGNITINNGMSFSEIRELFNDLFELNFPRLVDIAAEKAKENLLDFLKIFSNELNENKEEINYDKFSSPNTQYLFTSTIKEVACKGNNLDFLSEVLITGLRSDSTEMLDIIAEQALGLVPRLTNLHISIITLNHYIRNMRFDGINNISDLAKEHSSIFNILGDMKDISMNAIYYISSLGLASYVNVVEHKEYENVFKNTYPELYENKNEDEIKIDIANKSLAMKEMFDIFCEKKVFQLTLNPVGKLIALINLKKIYGKLDYSIWIN
jgi:hypothetical protein